MKWWTDSWNPVVGCTAAPGMEGCRNCYAKALHAMRRAALFNGKKIPPQYKRPFSQIQIMHNRVDNPKNWQKPRRIFVNSMSDIYHPQVSDEFIDRIFGTMMATQQHTYIISTKRIGRACIYHKGLIETAVNCGEPDPHRFMGHVHLLASASNQEEYDAVAPVVSSIPVGVSGVNLEPLLGPIKLKLMATYRTLEQVIVGCESGQDRRPCKMEWIEDIVGQCRRARVPVWVKQVPFGGGISTNAVNWPEAVQVQEWAE
jgi:protein gp37